MLLLIILLVLLFGGGGGYYGYSRWGTGGAWGSSGRSCSCWWLCTWSAGCVDLGRTALTPRERCGPLPRQENADASAINCRLWLMGWSACHSLCVIELLRTLPLGRF